MWGWSLYEHELRSGSGFRALGCWGWWLVVGGWWIVVW